MVRNLYFCCVWISINKCTSYVFYSLQCALSNKTQFRCKPKNYCQGEQRFRCNFDGYEVIFLNGIIDSKYSIHHCSIHYLETLTNKGPNFFVNFRGRMKKIDHNLGKVKKNIEYMEDMYEEVFRRINRLISNETHVNAIISFAQW